MGPGSFQPTNIYISKLYWWFVAATTGLGLIAQIIQKLDYRIRFVRPRALQVNICVNLMHSRARRAASTGFHLKRATRPHNNLWQFYATTRTLFRELAYPQPWIVTKPHLTFLTSLSLGRCLMIFAYWIVITLMLTVNAITDISDSIDSQCYR